MVSSYPDSPHARLIQTVCDILKECWDLRYFANVLHRTMTCAGFNVTTSPQELGYCLVQGQWRECSCYMHPSALDSNWSLKLGPPLLSPSPTYPLYLPCLLTGVPSNGRKWCHSWAAELLSMAAWLQVPILSGFPHATVRRATHAAIVRGLSKQVNTISHKQCGSCISPGAVASRSFAFGGRSAMPSATPAGFKTNTVFGLFLATSSLMACLVHGARTSPH